MKKNIKFYAIFIFLFAFSLVLVSQNTPIKEPKQLWTIEEVKDMAKKYNFQDSISSTKRNFLVYLDKKGIEKHFMDEVKVRQHRNEMKTYLEKTKYVRTFDDDNNLLNSYPTVRAQTVKGRGGEIKHLEYIKAARKYQWRIYRNSIGGLAFYRADQPVMKSESDWGQRIDNLPKTQ